MTYQELTEERNKMDAKILEAINVFEIKTGLHVTYVNLQSSMGIDGNHTTYSVQSDVQL